MQQAPSRRRSLRLQQQQRPQGEAIDGRIRQGHGGAADAGTPPSLAQYHRRRLLLLVCLSRVALIAYAIVADALLPDHDAEGALKLDTAGLPSYLRPFTRWDAAHFLSIAQAGGYPSLPSHAFFPLYPFLVRVVASWGSRSSANGDPSLAVVVASALLVSFVSALVATLSLHELGRRLFASGSSGSTAGKAAAAAGVEGERLAYLAALLYVFSPASIFFTTAYSEALFSALTFTGLLLVLPISTRTQWWELPWFYLGCLLLAGATATRANGLFNCLPLALPAAAPLISHLWATATAGAFPWLPWAADAVLRAVGCLAVVAPYVAFQYHGWRKYCVDGAAADPGWDDLSWCQARIPSLYSHIQSEYWHVGFLRYWQLKQLPNFLLAAPVLALSALGTHRYFTSLVGKPKQKTSALSALYAQPGLLGLQLQWLLLTALALFVAHVQIATRLLGAACPCLYWFAALRLLETGKEGNGFRRCLLVYYVVYNALGPLLHCNFLPWT